MSHKIRRYILLCVVASCVCLLQAQDITKGSIAGVIRDASGAVLANAKVRLDSPYGERTTTTNGAGEYTFSNLVVGSGYTLIVEQPGFAAAKQSNLSVGVNQRTTADMILQIGSTTQAVEVTSEATETIDLVTTTIGANIDESLYKNIPVGRNISSLISMSPGTADGLGTGAANPSINGASGLENEYVINGANVTDPGFGGFGTFSRVYGSLGNGVNFDFIQEVQVKTGGFEAEYGQALGGVINILTKSGGNTYHGSFYGYFAPKGMAVDAKNANPLLQNQGVYISGDSKYDFGGNLGGYIKKDKLFWYGGFNPQYVHDFRSAPAAFGNSKLGTISVDTRTLNYQGKINYNLSPNHSFEGSVFGDPSTVPMGYTRLGSLASDDNLQTSSLDYGSRTWTGRYNGTLTPKWILSVNYSNYYNHFQETPKFNGIQVIDITPSEEPGNTNPTRTYNGVGFLEGTESKVNELSATSSHLFSFLGGHTVDYGYQFEDVSYDDKYGYNGPTFQLPNLPEFGIAAGQTQYGGVFQRQHANPNDPTSPIVLEDVRGNYSKPVVVTSTRYHAGFIQDSWTIGRRITIKPGLRFEQQAETGNAFRYVFSHNWAPRIGVIVDPTGNRKSKFFANWGRFYEKIPLDIAVRSFSFETSANNGYWKDTGPGNAPDTSASAYIPVAQGGNAPVLLGSPLFAENVYPGTRSQFQDEVVGGYEHEFKGGMTLSSRFVYRHLRRVLEDTSGINVTQALAGVQLNYVVANPSAKSDDFQNPVVCTSGPDCTGGYTNNSGALGPDGKPDGFPNPTRIYKAAELVFSKRFSRGFQLYASYRLAKLVGNYEGNFRNDNGQSDPNISSMFDFTNTDGRLADQYKVGLLPTDRTNQFKFFSNYEWKGFNFGVTWIAQSGTPLSAFNAHPAYTNPGEIPIGGRGTKGRTPATFPLDFHTDYTVKLGEQKRLKFGINMFNMFNQSRALFLDQNLELAPGTPDPDYHKPFGIFTQANAYQSPFVAQLSARFEF
jgi:hypothetical protein